MFLPYSPKPYSIRNVVARVKAVLRRRVPKAASLTADTGVKDAPLSFQGLSGPTKSRRWYVSLIHEAITVARLGDNVPAVFPELGLDLGADDYITKPYSIRNVVARVKAVLRRRVPGHTASSISSRENTRPGLRNSIDSISNSLRGIFTSAPSTVQIFCNGKTDGFTFQP